MQYSLTLPTGGVCGDPRTLAELAALAESVGWDGVFIEDYICYHGNQNIPTCDPWVALAAMALVPSRIRLGTRVTPLSRRRPWKLAREAVSVDQLSNGRLILAAGLGDANDPGFDQVGEMLDARQRAEMLDEALDIIAGLWTGEPFSYQGKHYQVRDLRFLPRPVQQPRIPIWIGGAWPLKGPSRRAARWDGSCLYKDAPPEMDGRMLPEDIRAMRAFIASHRSAGEPFAISIGGGERREDWEQERDHIRAVAEAGATWWGEWMPPQDLEDIRSRIQRGPLRID